jgi:ubiquitin C-terminal hydrolase
LADAVELDLDRRLRRAQLLGHRPPPAAPVVQRLLVRREGLLFGQVSYDVGIGNPVVIIETVNKPDGKVFYHRVREHSQNPADDGRVHYYFPDTDRMIPSIIDVENYLLAAKIPQDALDTALEPAYSNPKLAKRYIELALDEDLESLRSLVDVDYRRESDEPQGLPNRRFDCFLNAVIQIMAGPYSSFFDPTKLAAPLSKAGEAVRAAVWTFSQRINNEDATEITEDDVEKLRTTMLANKMVLSMNDQEDAAELMRKILEVVLPAGESVGLRLERSIDAKDTKAIERGTLGPSPAQYVGGKRSQAESSNMIEVEMDRYNSLHAFLYEQFGKGVVTEFDAKNRPKVESDTNPVEVSKVTERRAFTRLPGVLSFFLKRFRERLMGGKERIGKQFEMPKSLFLIDESGPVKSYVEYELAGVVVQTGTLSGGHYYSHVKREDEWHKLDDDKALKKDKVDQDLDQGYIYTFRRVKAHTALPKGAQALQETEAKPGEINLDAELGRFGSVLDTSSKSSASTPKGKKSDLIKGLPNRRDDCFLNAVLQLMAGPYSALFDPEENEVAPAKKEFQAQLWNLMQRINKKAEGVITPEEIGELRKAMAAAKLTEGESGQEDAADVVRRLLVLVMPAESLATVETERSFEAKDARIVKQRELPRNPAVYAGGKSTGSLDTGIIPVEMTGFNSLEGFLYQQYGVGETIEYDAKNRPKVLQGQHAMALSKVKQRKIFKQLPPLLTFALHRFRIESDGSRVRIDRKFAMPHDLVLMEQAEGPDSKEAVEFELVAVVVQRGGLEGGHYYTHRKDEETGKWLRADDESVTESDSPGSDLNEGYLYTYRRKKKASKSTVPAQETAELFASDDLGKRLVYLIKTKKYAEAKELLSFPSLDVNVPMKDKATPLYLAVEGDQADLVARLLERGADPTAAGPLGTPAELATALNAGPKIKMALQIYSTSDFGKTLGAVRSAKPGVKKGEKLDPAAMLRIFAQLSNFEALLGQQIASIANPARASQEEMVGLARALEGAQEQRRLLNEWLAEFFEIQRAGPGGRPDAAKAVTLPEVGREDLKFLKAYVKEAKPESDERSEEEFLASGGKGEREKLVQEALTALFAVRRELFDTVEPGAWEHDIDLSADDTPWDQKAIVFEKGSEDFAGRLKETHHKYNKKVVGVGETFDASTRPSEQKKREEKYRKVGLLFDSTYVLAKQYEMAWQRIFETVLRGELDPRYIKETRAPEEVGMVSERFFETTDRNKEPWALSVLKAEEIATPGEPRSTIASTALPSALQDHLLAIVQGTVEAYTAHQNDRGWLPGGVLYFEYSTGSGSDAKSLGGSHCKLVISHDCQHIYLSCSHYKGFTYKKGDHFISRPAFYEIVPAGPLAKALGKTVEEPVSTSGGETTGATVGTAPKKEKKKGRNRT